MEDIKLTAAEYHYLKTLVMLKQESQESDKVRNIDLTNLYGKLNVLWSEARKEARKAGA
jgi:hypothetical protein